MESPGILFLIFAVLGLVMSFVSFKFKKEQVIARKEKVPLIAITIWSTAIIIWAIIAFIVNH